MKIRNILFTAIATVALLGATAQSGADVIVKTVDASIQTAGWMNVAAPEGDWGSGWAVADLRSSMPDAQTVFLQTNVNGFEDNPGDPYWAPGHITMEANSYGETPVVAGDVVQFFFSVLDNPLASQGYATEAFIKVLDPGAGWATIQNERYDLATLGDGSINLIVGADGVAQVGFAITGNTDYIGSGLDTLGVTVTAIPEPATFGLLGLFGGGLLLFRRNFRV